MLQPMKWRGSYRTEKSVGHHNPDIYQQWRPLLDSGPNLRCLSFSPVAIRVTAAACEHTAIADTAKGDGTTPTRFNTEGSVSYSRAMVVYWWKAACSR